MRVQATGDVVNLASYWEVLPLKHKLFAFVAVGALAALGAPAAFCDSVVANQWYAIQWSGSVGTPVFNSPGYTGSQGTVLQDPGASPWTYTAGPSGAELIVSDLYIHGDQFSVFNGASVIGNTSTPGNDGGTCGNDPVSCLNDPLASHGFFFLVPGLSTISMSVIAEASGFTGGGAAFEIFTSSTAAPEPGSVGLFLLGAAGILAAKRRFIKR